jgi:hypothetical protein
MAEEKVIIIKPRGNDIFIKEQPGKPVTIDPPKGGALWGRIVGDIKNQADLKEKLDELRILAYAGL